MIAVLLTGSQALDERDCPRAETFLAIGIPPDHPISEKIRL
jgi:hypothetical protein